MFSNEIVMDAAAKGVAAGSLAIFKAHDQTYIGIGSFNPHTLIAGRIFSRAPVEEINKDWFVGRLRRALALREKLVSVPFYRLVHAEADGLPGLIVDRFGNSLSVQVNAAGMELLWPEIQAALVELFNPESIVLHNDSGSRALEGLEKLVSVALGKISGPIEVEENGITYFADLYEGQKTGWYFDQRDNHALVARYAHGASMLDLYCHAGGFGVLAAKAGATKVIGVDSSARALELAKMAAERNGIDKICAWHKADVFEDLDARISVGEKYEIVIADPPAFVKSRKDIASGGRGYRKLARLSAQVTAPEGLLFIASCSHNMSLDQFTEEVARGLSDAKRSGQITHTVFAAPDHPVHPHLPESSYLKGLLIRLD